MSNSRTRRLELTGAVLTGVVHANMTANLRIGSACSINLGTLTALAKAMHTPSYLDVRTDVIERE